MILSAISIAAVVASLALLVAAIFQARSAAADDTKLIEALKRNQDALLNLDSALGRAISSVEGLQKAPPPTRPHEHVEQLLAKWKLVRTFPSRPCTHEVGEWLNQAHSYTPRRRRYDAASAWRHIAASDPVLTQRRLEMAIHAHATGDEQYRLPLQLLGYLKTGTVTPVDSPGKACRVLDEDPSFGVCAH